MSSVNSILQKVQGGALTCSQVLEIMMAQPTHDETSHAQMHLLDSFQWNPLAWKTHYQKQTQAYQAQVSEAGCGRTRVAMVLFGTSRTVGFESRAWLRPR